MNKGPKDKKNRSWMWVVLALIVLGALGYLLTNQKANAPLQEENEEREESVIETGDRPSFLWEFFPAGEDAQTGASRTQVSLSVNGEARDVGTFDGSCLVLNGSAWELAENELTGVICWFAGGGDEVGVFYENGEYVVKQGVLEEGMEGEQGLRGNYEVLFTL